MDKEQLAGLLGIDPSDPNADAAIEEALRSLFEGTQTFPEQLDANREQMGLANEMRNTAAPDMRQVGRVAVAANPLEMLGAGMGRVRGEKDMTTAMGERQTMIDLLRKGRGVGGRMSMRDRYGMEGAPPRPQPDPYGDELKDPFSSIPDLLRRPQG